MTHKFHLTAKLCKEVLWSAAWHTLPQQVESNEGNFSDCLFSRFSGQWWTMWFPLIKTAVLFWRIRFAYWRQRLVSEKVCHGKYWWALCYVMGSQLTSCFHTGDKVSIHAHCYTQWCRGWGWESGDCYEYSQENHHYTGLNRFKNLAWYFAFYPCTHS